MRLFFAALCVAGMAISAGRSGGADQAQPKDRSPLTAAGELPKVRKQLEKVFQFTLKGSHLAINRQAWGTPAKEKPPGGGFLAPPAVVGGFPAAPPIEGVFQAIQASAGANGSGMSIGGNNREVSFSGPNLSGRLGTQGDSVRLILDETASPQRTLEFNDDGRGGFRIQLSDPDGDLLLLNQSRGGSFAVVSMHGGQVFADQGESFLAFFRKNRKEMETRILPTLDKFGIQPLLNPSTPKARKAVLALLSRTPEAEDEGRRLLADLDSDTFEVRERAARSLNERYEIYKDLIQDRLKDRSLSLEVQKRLRDIAARHADSAWVGQTIAALDLLQDPGYLVSLLDEASAKESPGLIRQLEKTTGKKLGPEPAAWKEWLSK